MGEIVFLLLISGACIAYYIVTLSYTVPLFEKTGGASVFPQIIIIILLALCLLRTLIILVRREKKHFVFFELFKSTTGVFFISFLVYVFTMKYLGYILGTSLFLIGTTCYLKYKTDGTIGTVKSIIIRSALLILAAFGISLFFSSLLHVRIPTGFLGELF